MIDQLRNVLLGQFEASLDMLNQCVQLCPDEHWDAKIANDTFRQVSYHTLFFADLYLTANEEAFVLRELHHRGGDERTSTTASAGLGRAETLAYALTCRSKGRATLTSETVDQLQGPSGFHWQPCSRLELHLYNVRHIQHHTGALSAFLRRLGLGAKWVKSGWQS